MTSVPQSSPFGHTTFPARAAIPAFNAVTLLQRWIRPGLAAFHVAMLAHALSPVARRVSQERDALGEELALKYPALVPDGPDKGKAHPRAGKVVMQPMANRVIPAFATFEIAEEYTRRLEEVFDAPVTINAPLLTARLMELIERDRLADPKMPDGTPVATVDYAHLVPLMVLDGIDTLGEIAPLTSSSGDTD